ncbi:probable transcription repressor OFP9 [Miscanthus floridulus]|uniref:probable transcription repressor OFP9 n=1 Tax=Miscanthus floridulus TaxID=154761 RepID=UPI0034598A63
MQLFSGRSKQEHKIGGGGKCHAVSGTTRHSKGGGKCRALCCGASRLSVSSAASCSSADAAPEPLPLPPPTTTTQTRGLSKLAHGMVQARLQSMIDAAEAGGRPPPVARRPGELAERHRRGLPRAWARGGGGGGGACYEKGVREQAAATRRTTCVVLLAEDRRTHNPREEFRRSIAEVIAAKRMAEPAELRALLNCYVSVNAREHRAAILQAFHEVCSALFSCKQLG